MKSRILFLLVLGALVLSSCSTITKSSYCPDRSQLNISMADLDYLGEVEISVDYESYLGIFSTIKAINGADYDPSVTTRGAIVMSNYAGAKLLPMLNRASYYVYEKYPQAEYFIVTRQNSEQSILFLGREIINSAVVSAYRFKR